MTSIEWLRRILDSNVVELMNIQWTSPPLPFDTYVRFLVAYHQGDDAEMQRLASHSADPDVLLLMNARIKLRSGDLAPFPWSELKRVSNGADHWRGEAAFLSAQAYAKQSQWEQSRDFFLGAAEAFLQQGILRKSLRSLYNSVGIESRIAVSGPPFVGDYSELVRLGATLKESSVVAQGLHNLAYELNRIGALTLAVRTMENAEKNLDGELRSLNYYRTKSLHALLLLDIQRTSYAEALIEECKSAPFAEIQRNAQLLSLLMSGDDDALATFSGEDQLEPAWKQRLIEVRSQRDSPKKPFLLSSSEERLLELLCERPRSPRELRTLLYPEVKEQRVSQVRTKSLTVRTRRRLGDQIQYSGNLYSLKCRSILATNPKAKRILQELFRMSATKVEDTALGT